MADLIAEIDEVRLEKAQLEERNQLLEKVLALSSRQQAPVATKGLLELVRVSCHHVILADMSFWLTCCEPRPHTPWPLPGPLSPCPAPGTPPTLVQPLLPWAAPPSPLSPCSTPSLFPFALGPT